MDFDYAVYLSEIVDWVVRITPRILIVFIAYGLGKWVFGKLEVMLSKAIKKSNIDEEISSFLISLTKIVLYLTLIIILVAILGVEVSALVGFVAAIGFAVGLALQGFLGNFAAR